MSEIIYEPHPVSPERKAELRAQGFRIIDAVFAPKGFVPQDDGRLPEVEERALLIAELKELGVEFDETMGTDELRALTITDPATEQNGGDGLDELDAEQLHALAKERGVNVHHASGADKVRAALREAAQ